ncbi:carbohydrate ABC transporter permease [Actinobacteria bacterium YIM 96077]|uniref:Carbohydrate ABC transporter permease n=1 Tax=Phytoactinopolyspora halophila TaxID=1981511 RepID=A0A329QK05_9ACTN|nr:carbohydrate ABC transporter permease [Phytoactinopolyspora halophila]AYY12540.1 carbohydrate ABC transporter permease [Actinobacteria bacterium YIM 96077]RAW12556.1 carbohydrate ABC transporter permease [Phytoactinopolyspora halophila]
MNHLVRTPERARPGAASTGTPPSKAPETRRHTRRRLRTARRAPAPEERGVLSEFDRDRAAVRWGLRIAQALVLVGLIAASLGPMLWLAKAAISTTQDTLREPLALWPSGIQWENLATAWNQAEINRYFLNTVWVATGSWFFQLLVATTGGYVLAVLRPRFTKLLTGAVLATLFVPGVVVLVPLFLTVLDVPLFGVSLLNTYWAVWLPAGANAFNVLLVKRFMDNLPRDVFEAARVDGAGPFRLLLFVVLPMSKPILGVVSIFAVLHAWKDFLWPLIVLPEPQLQPLSVRLPVIRDTVTLDVFLASLLISTLLPIAIFLIFQRLFLRNAGLGNAVKA